MTTTASATTSPDRTEQARLLLMADAVLTGVNGLGYLTLVGVLDTMFGVAPRLLLGLGALLLVVAAEVAFLATRRPIPAPWLRALAMFNLAWVLASVAFAALADLTTAGVVWTTLQAVIVAGFAARQLQLAARL